MYSLLQKRVDSDAFMGYLQCDESERASADARVPGPASGGDGVAMELINLDDIIHLDDDEINEAVILSQHSFWTPDAEAGCGAGGGCASGEGGSGRMCPDIDGAATEPDVLSAEIYINREVCNENAANDNVAANGEATAGPCTLVLKEKNAGIVDDYVIVEMADVVDAMAHFIAAYVMIQPKAKTISPEELHAQLKLTFRGTEHAHVYRHDKGGQDERRRRRRGLLTPQLNCLCTVCALCTFVNAAELQRGYIRRAWDGGKAVFRYATLTYSAASACTQPWLAQTVLSAFWWMSRRVAGLAVYTIAGV